MNIYQILFKACAQAIGSLSFSHAELVINKLNDINKSTKVSFLVNFFKVTYDNYHVIF